MSVLRKKSNKRFGKLEIVIIVLAIAFALLRIVFGARSSTASEEEPMVGAPIFGVESTEEDDGAEDELSVKTREVYNDNDVKISITGAEDTGDSINVSFLFESSSKLDLSIYAHAYSANGIMADNNIYDMDTPLPAGKKANSTLEIPKAVMAPDGVEANDFLYADVLFWAYDDAENFRSFETDIIRIESDQYVGDIEYKNDTKSYDEDGIEVGVVGQLDDSVVFSVINNTDSYLTFDLASVSVNGYGFDPGIQVFDKIVFPGAISVCKLDIDDEFKTSNGIERISETEFKLNYRPCGSFHDEKTTGVIVLGKN